MLFEKMSPKKLRAKIIRKGIFSQLYYPSKENEHDHRMFRAVLDGALYDFTSASKSKRFEVYEWLNPYDDNFQQVCLHAGLDIVKTYNMFLFFLNNYFKDYIKEFTCFKRQHGAILKVPKV